MTKFLRMQLSPFSGTHRTRWIPAVGNALRPAFERLAASLRLVARARAEGTQNRPLTSDTDLDEAQRQICADVQGGGNALKQFLSDQLNDAEEKILKRMPAPLDAALTTADVAAAAARARLDHGEAIEGARVEERRAFRSLRKFRRDHQLAREAHYSPTRIWPIAMLAGMWLLESALNSVLFRNGVNGGEAEGIALAGICSAVNILLGFLVVGLLGARLIGHANGWKKLLGGVVFLAGLGAGLDWNLTVAHFRDALARGADASAFIASLPSAWQQPFAFAGIESAALFALGIAIFIVAALEGHGGRGRLVDSYWGYREADHAHRMAEAAHEHARDGYKMAVGEAFAAARRKLSAQQARDATIIAEIREIAGEAGERAAEVRDSIGEWIDIGNALLRRYREENMAVRTDSPPAYYARFPDLGGLLAGLPDCSRIAAAAAEAIALHERNSAELARLERELALAMGRETDTFFAHTDAIEERAQARLAQDEDADGEPPRPVQRVPKHNLREVA